MSWKCLCNTVNNDKWSRCIGCNGEYQEKYKIIDIHKQDNIVNSENNIISPIKIAPNSGYSLRYRITGLLFGISIALIIFIVVLKLNLWHEFSLYIYKHLLYIVIISGLIGFIFGNKYRKQIDAFYESVIDKKF